MTRTITLDGVPLTLAAPDDHESDWVDYNEYVLQLKAAWIRLSTVEPPLNPRLIGESGLGKTTLACFVGRNLEREVHIFQCTMDTRPEDLLITPVLADDQRIEYRASPAVTAMIRGGVLLLDEANRMPERSWASLAPLMDDRRYIESAITGLKIRAHENFRLCITMNDDASVYELPAYIQSRLKPKIEIVKPPWDIQEQILRLKCPGVDSDLLCDVFVELKRRSATDCRDSIRDMLTLAQYAQKLRNCGLSDPLGRAIHQVLLKPDAMEAA